MNQSLSKGPHHKKVRAALDAVIKSAQELNESVAPQVVAEQVRRAEKLRAAGANAPQPDYMQNRN